MRHPYKDETDMIFSAVPIPQSDGTLRYVLAGPTSAQVGGYDLVKCARECDPPTPDLHVAYDIGTKDFQPFEDAKLAEVIPQILFDLRNDHRLYVGCMGGIGRTGTVLSILVAQHPFFTAATAVQWVRSHHNSGCVETLAQLEQVHRHAHKYQPAGRPAPTLQPAPRIHLMEDLLEPEAYPVWDKRSRPGFIRRLFGGRDG